MRSRTRMIAAAATVTAALAAGSGAAVASAAGTEHGAHAKTVSASKKAGGPTEKAGHDAMVAAVARDLHASPARVRAALRPLFAAGRADTSSPVFAAAARSLGVSPHQLFGALAHAKQSLAGGVYAEQSPAGSKSVGSNAAEERQGHDAMVAAVARDLHASPARVRAALRPLFAAGRADTSSPVFAAAARSLGVSPHQLFGALAQAKQSLAGGK
jgi:2-hydroxychromene-2-carboxylate isomerase